VQQKPSREGGLVLEDHSDGGMGYISHEFNRGEVENYGEVMVRRQNKGDTS